MKKGFRVLPFAAATAVLLSCSDPAGPRIPSPDEPPDDDDQPDVVASFVVECNVTASPPAVCHEPDL